VISASERRRNRGGSPYGVVRGSGAARGQSKVSPRPWAWHQARMAANLREQLVMCVAPAYRVEAGSVASDVCCQIAAKNDQVPFVTTSKGTLKGLL
jgi:hypothetical protein